MARPLTPAQRWAVDAAERTAGTFVVVFLGTWLVNPGFDLDAAQAAAAAGVAAAGTVLKALIGSKLGARDTAAWLPVSKDTPRPAAGG